MAVDTVDKRSSAINIAFPVGRVFATPDASLSVYDRMQADYSYSGIFPALSVASITCEVGVFTLTGNMVSFSSDIDDIMLFPVDPKASPLTRAFEQKVQVLLNSLMRARQFGLTDDNTWTMRITSDVIAASGALVNGTYTPTASAPVNLTLYSAFPSVYSRVGNVVTVSGSIQVTPTGTGATSVDLSLPISSNLTATYQLSGSGNSVESAAHGVSISANVTSDVATLSWRAPDTNARTITYIFSYLLN